MWLNLELAKTQAARPKCEGFFSVGSFEVKTHPKSRLYLLVAAHIKEQRRNFWLFACLLSLSLVSLLTLFLSYSFAGVRTQFFGIPIQNANRQLGRLRTQNKRHSVKWIEQLPDPWPFPQEIVTVGLLEPQLISHFNTFFSIY